MCSEPLVLRLRKLGLLREDRQGSSSGDLLNGFGYETVLNLACRPAHNFELKLLPGIGH